MQFSLCLQFDASVRERRTASWPRTAISSVACRRQAEPSPTRCPLSEIDPGLGVHGDAGQVVIEPPALHHRNDRQVWGQAPQLQEVLDRPLLVIYDG